ncbi:hypothetical protein EWB00_004612 [Schistosoma japonicum]|uniref:Uncharacterized protein n=1 Tax=Schistosoma japonicum TaxID=6182 RepID=C1LKS4_SCHJA|nr:hypothetical protein KSF78_0001257 [Schistosoma japonicum]KAH8852869.1 hypothetical protein KSF78_0001257 [Schistosoma japonicum]KAH8852870.1 hypothetical protein KSF78_0001257 [Schistosoma japonicum]KAH8852872.1 hypothetical protein KSF78_0001257 [Schistosoma japonicum]TNN11374.1 hypothetical protein EWB00_004612 [Schistosoma japonicum]
MSNQRSVSERSSISLYCSDGICDLDDQNNEECSNTVNSDNIILRAIDWCGEKLAWTFGITSPKYFYVIENCKTETPKQDSIDLGDMNDPHVAILECLVSKESSANQSHLSFG